MRRFLLPQRVRPSNVGEDGIHVSLSRDAVPVIESGAHDIMPDALRPSHEFADGKPFPWPGQSLAYEFHPDLWTDPPPMGFLPNVPHRQRIHYQAARPVPQLDPVNIEAPQAVAYGSLFTYYGKS